MFETTMQLIGWAMLFAVVVYMVYSFINKD